MVSINFYESSVDTSTRAACKLLEKAYQVSYNAVVKVRNEDEAHLLDKELWTFAQKSFIPHATYNDPYPTLQPIYITTGSENPNNSKLLLLIGTLDGVFDQFDKIFVIFDSTNLEMHQEVKNYYPKLSIPSNTINYYIQNNKGGWASRG